MGNYTAEDLKVITTIEAVRKRPGMYLGSDERFVENVAEEIVSNSLDQFHAGLAAWVKVEASGHTVEVTDDGGGMRFVAESDELAVEVFRQMHSTPSRFRHAPHVHIGLHGVGLAPLNALAKSMLIETWVDGTGYRLRFENAELVGHVEHDIGPGHGTRVRWVGDSSYYNHHELNTASLRALLWHAAHINAGMTIELNGERFCAPNGLLDYAYTLMHPATHWEPRVHHLKGEHNKVRYEIVLLGEAEETRFTSFANGLQNRGGGSHQDALAEAIADIKPPFAVALIHIIALKPEYAAPTRDKLRMPGLDEVVRHALEQSRLSDLQETKNPANRGAE